MQEVTRQQEVADIDGLRCGLTGGCVGQIPDLRKGEEDSF